MYPIKQSTALTVPFFVHDANGDAVTGLTDGSFTKRLSKNGAAFGAMTVTISEMENGWYSIPLSASHSDTVGLLSVLFTNAGAKQVNLQFRIHANLPDDLSTDIGTVDTVVDGIQTDLDNGTDGLGAIKAETALIVADTNELQTDDVPGLIAALNDPTSAAIADAVLDEALSGHVVAGSLGKAVADIEADTNELQTDDVPGLIAALNDPTAAAIADAVWDELQSAHVTVGSFGEIATEIASILADTNELQTDDVPGLIAALNDPAASAIADAVWDEVQSGHVAVGSFGEVATEVAAILADTADMQPKLGTPAGASVSADIAAVKVDTAAILVDTGTSGVPLTAAAVDAILDETIGDGTITMRQVLKLAVAALGGKLSGAATTTVTIRNDADDTDVITATVDADGNRSAVTLSL